jgi:hypothetical protein
LQQSFRPIVDEQDALPGTQRSMLEGDNDPCRSRTDHAQINAMGCVQNQTLLRSDCFRSLSSTARLPA